MRRRGREGQRSRALLREAVGNAGVRQCAGPGVLKPPVVEHDGGCAGRREIGRRVHRNAFRNAERAACEDHLAGKGRRGSDDIRSAFNRQVGHLGAGERHVRRADLLRVARVAAAGERAAKGARLVPSADFERVAEFLVALAVVVAVEVDFTVQRAHLVCRAVAARAKHVVPSPLAICRGKIVCGILPEGRFIHHIDTCRVFVTGKMVGKHAAEIRSIAVQAHLVIGTVSVATGNQRSGACQRAVKIGGRIAGVSRRDSQHIRRSGDDLQVVRDLGLRPTIRCPVRNVDGHAREADQAGTADCQRRRVV